MESGSPVSQGTSLRSLWRGSLCRAAAVLAAALPGTPPPALAVSPPQARVAFVGVDVLTMDADRVLRDQTVVVADGRIVSVNPRDQTPIPVGAKRIDGRGATLLPGLADMHAHLTGYANTDGKAGDDGVARAQMLGYVATGVTLVRNMAGSAAHLGYAHRVAAGELVGPRIFTATNIVDGPNPVWAWSIKLGEGADVDDLVAGFVRDGYHQIKVYNELPRQVYAALFDAAAKHGVPVVGHVPFSIGIDAALAARQHSIEHFRGYDYDAVRPQALLLDGGRNAERFSSWMRISDERMRDLVAKTVAAGTWNCPTFVIDAQMSDPAGRMKVARDSRMRFVHPRIRETLQGNQLDAIFSPESRDALRKSLPQRYKLLKMLDDAGAGLLVGTDSLTPFLVPGYTPIDELKHFVAAGLTPYRALRAATADPARFLGIEAEAGTVAVGKRADLLLVEGNPLDDLDNLWRRRGVMVAGRWYGEQELQAMLEHAAKTFPSGPARAAQ
jgi:imidazolonepropionase-like amidohydrolase